MSPRPLAVTARQADVVVGWSWQWTYGHELPSIKGNMHPDILSDFNPVSTFEAVGLRDLSLLAAQVRAARGLLDWSQAYLAEGCNIHRGTLVDLESGKREPHEATLAVLMS
jgi:DNA-binding XRE family transcriptional regulator